MAAANPPTTYAQLYQHGTDLLQGQYGNYLAPFDPESGTQPAALRDAVIRAEQAVPKVYAYIVAQPNPTVRALSRVTHVNATLGMQSPLDNETFAFASDIGPGNQVAVVYFPTGQNGAVVTDAPFTIGPLTTVPTLDHMGPAFTAAGGADCIGPYNLGDPNTEQIRARRLVPIPQRYAHLVLGRDFTPEQFWNTVATAIIADNNEVSCAVVLNWARVAATYRPGPPPVPPVAGAAAGVAAPPGGPLAPGICITNLQPPLNVQHLQQKVWSFIISDLPALVVNTTGLGQHLVNISNELAQGRQEQTTARAVATQSAADKNKFSQKFVNYYETIWSLCQVGRDEDLSDLLQAMTTVDKSSHSALLQSAMDNRSANHPNNFNAPQCTPALVTIFKSFRYGSNDMDDMMASPSPCLLASPNLLSTEGARARMVVYNMVMGQQANVDMGELRALIATAPDFVSTSWELVANNEEFSVFLDVLLKPEHPTSVSFREFCINLRRVAGQIESNFTPDEIHALVPRIIRMIQLECFRNFNDLKRNGTGAEPAKFMDVIRLIESRTWGLLPSLPRRYLQPAAPPVAPALLPAGGGGGGGGGAAILPNGAAGRGGGGGAAILPNGAAGRGRTQTAVRNTNSNAPLVERFAAAARTLRDITTNRVLPKTDNGQAELCLSWHLRCNCFRECNRASTHRVLSATEAGRIGDLLTAAGLP